MRDWLGLMERSRLEFEKTKLQAYTDPAVEVMEKTLCGRGEAIHCFFFFLDN